MSDGSVKRDDELNYYISQSDEGAAHIRIPEGTFKINASDEVKPGEIRMANAIDTGKKLQNAYDRALGQMYTTVDPNSNIKAAWDSSTTKRLAEERSKALEKLRKMQAAAEEHARQQAQGATSITDEQLKEYYLNILMEQGDDAKVRVLRTLEERVKQLEKALKEAGTRDPLLVATNDVLADENKRLTSEIERLLEEQGDLRRRLDEAHNRLYKTIDILQERANASGSNIVSSAGEGAQAQAQEAQEVSREAHLREGCGAQPAARGSEHDVEGGQRKAAEESEGARGENPRSLSVVGGTRS